MKVHVVWTPVERANPLRSGAGLVALVTPDGMRVVHVGLQTQRFTLRPTAPSGEQPELARYLLKSGMRQDQLRVLVGELHLPGGEELGPLILRDVLNVLLLSEEPPGNVSLPGDLPLPLESVNVLNQGNAWPGYERASLEPDGDVLVNHVILSSLIPPPHA